MSNQKGCDFCTCTNEWEDIDNHFFMEFRFDTPWHGVHINLGFESDVESNIEIDFNFCPICGRKLVEGKINKEEWQSK